MLGFRQFVLGEAEDYDFFKYKHASEKLWNDDEAGKLHNRAMHKENLGQLATKHHWHHMMSGHYGYEGDLSGKEQSQHRKKANTIVNHVQKRYDGDTALRMVHHADTLHNHAFGYGHDHHALQDHPFKKDMKKHGGFDHYKKHSLERDVHHQFPNDFAPKDGSHPWHGWHGDGNKNVNPPKDKNEAYNPVGVKKGKPEDHVAGKKHAEGETAKVDQGSSPKTVTEAKDQGIDLIIGATKNARDAEREVAKVYKVSPAQAKKLVQQAMKNKGRR